MTDIGWDFVPSNRQELRLPKSIGAAVSELMTRCWRYNTAKHLVQAFGYEPSTAENVKKGHVSERSLTRMVHTQQSRSGNAWELWDALGAEVIGETREQYEERKLRIIIEEAERAQQGVQRLRTRREHLERLAAALVDLESREPAAPGWRGDGGLGRSAHDLGEHAPGQSPLLGEPESFSPRGRREDGGR